MPTVRLPRLLETATGGKRQVEVSGGTVAEVLADLCRQQPGLRQHLMDESGSVRTHVVLITGGYDRTRQLDTPVEPGEEVTVLQAVSGG